jgi:ElaB/YqjD/DUF883 family membrane-anchored ribosome-binding protein
MAFASDTRNTMDNAQAQIDRLRDQVEALIKDRVTPAMADFAGRAESAVKNARGSVKEQADAVSGQVRKQPLLAILIAVGFGWLIGRAMR